MQELLKTGGRLFQFSKFARGEGRGARGRGAEARGARREGSGLRDVGDDPNHVVKFDVIAAVESPWNGFLADPSYTDLTLRIVGLGVVNVQGYLAVNADRLDLLHDHRL